VLAAATLAAAGARARGETLAELLAGVAASARFAAPLRADVRIACTPACTAARAVFLGRGDDLYVEVKDGPRALVRPREVHVAEGGSVRTAAPGRAVADTPILLEDLAVFTAAALRVPQISDDGPGGVVVMGAPASASAYALLVHTIDRERRTIVKTQYYRDSVSNLVKRRRDGAFVRVGDQWRPGEIDVEQLRDGRTVRLTATWRPAPDAPETLFDPAALGRPSGLDWPTE
jgi:hypothetical protein